MVDYTNFDLYTEETVDKQLVISFDGGTITNEDLHQEEFELTESLCSDSQLTFGSCEASEVKFRISNVFTSLKDKWLTITQILNGDTENPLQIGKYKVYSDTPTANRRYRDVVAYDQMYDIINADLTEWYNSLFPTDSTTVTLKEFRTSLMNYLGVEQEDVTLVNDDMVIEKTIQPTQLAGRDVVSAICEINGCFGHIGRDGKFHYVFLAKRIQGLYPANDLYPQDNLFPREQVTNKIDKSLYIDCQYEDYLSQEITKLQIRQEENDIGKTYPGGETTDLDNTYVVQGNFLVYGKEETELEDIAKKLFSVISGTEYRPYEAKAVGNPCFEVGDAIRFNTAYQIIESYILKRTLSGVQGLRDELSADGEEFLSENATGIESQMQQLRGKSNVLERNINETISQISDVERGLHSEIKQTADEITQNVSATYETIQSASATKAALESQIEQTAESITSTVASSQSKWDTTGVTVNIYGYGSPEEQYNPSEYSSLRYLDQSNGYLYLATTTEWIFVTELELITDELSSQIQQTAESIELKVSKGDVSTELSLENEQVSIKGDRLVVESTNFSLDENGNVGLTGSVHATELNADEKITIKSGWVFSETSLDNVDVLYTETEVIGGREWAIIHANIRYIDRGLTIKGALHAQDTISTSSNLYVAGTKSRLASTKNYNDRLLYCYEMPSPLFGDIGHGIIGNDGLCYVDIDSIFAETIDTIQQYYVFLQPYSDKPIYIKEKTENYFVVCGEPNTEFDWEIKAKQSDFPMERLEENSNDEFSDIDYVSSAEAYLENYEKELTV